MPKELGEQDEKIMGLEADTASSTKDGILGKAFPERYSNVGISRLDMVSMSAGFAREGLIPHVDTFTVSLTIRGVDPIQSLIAYDKLNAKLCGAYYRLSDPYDGTSHRATTDPAFMRAIPSMVVITVADAMETKRAVLAVAEYQGPVYLKLSRAAAPVLYPEDMKFEIGRDITIREGGDTTIITTGIVLHKAPAAAELLEAKGTRARAVGMHTIEPIDEELVIEYAKEVSTIMTVEEHSVCGGLGSAVAEVLVEHTPVPMTRIGTTDFTGSGGYEQLSVRYGCGPESIVGKCGKVMKHKQVQKK